LPSFCCAEKRRIFVSSCVWREWQQVAAKTIRLRSVAFFLRIFSAPGCMIKYFAPDRGAEHCDERVCLSVCLCFCVSVSDCVCVFVCPRSYLRNYTSDLHQIFVHLTYGRGSILLWRRSDMLRISGFMDDVIFAHELRLLDHTIYHMRLIM